MSRRVTAMFDSRETAENARIQLTRANIDQDRIRIVDQGHMTDSGEEGGFWSSLKSAFMPDEDGHAYEEGMRRGGYLLCAEVEEDKADEAIQILDREGTVDFDQRQQEWRSDGWQGFQRDSQQQPSSQQNMEAGRTVEEEHIPLVEEELRVGKREVARGGARVRSYVQERPVHEQVSLREEHVSVERRPVDQPLGRGDLDRNSDMLRDRTIEMTETAEEAVVGKEARVREELVLKKTAEQRTEQIDETVRRTEVEVDEGPSAGGRDRSAFSTFGGEKIASDADRVQRDNDRDRQTSGSGYSPQIDKSGL